MTQSVWVGAWPRVEDAEALHDGGADPAAVAALHVTLGFMRFTTATATVAASGYVTCLDWLTGFMPCEARVSGRADLYPRTDGPATVPVLLLSTPRLELAAMRLRRDYGHWLDTTYGGFLPHLTVAGLGAHARHVPHQTIRFDRVFLVFGDEYHRLGDPPQGRSPAGSPAPR